VGYTKDLWTRPGTGGDGKPARVRNARWGNGKRWLSVWHDEAGNEVSRAFAAKDAADKHWQAMETDRERGDYLDPRAGKESLGAIGKRWLASRVVDPSTRIRYESLWRLHVEPTFGSRAVKAIKPSAIQAWLAALDSRHGSSTAAGAYLVLQGCLDLAIADDQIKKNPTKSSVVSKPRAGIGGKVTPWTDAQASAVIDAHPDHLRLVAELMDSCGLRIGEALAVSEDDFDFAEHVLHVRRQIKVLGGVSIFGLPKSDEERDVPLPGWTAALARIHITKYKPRPCTLPWERVEGKPVTHSILFRWSDGEHVRYRSYSEQTWKPALAAARVIAAPQKDKRGRSRYATTRKEGPHQLRHHYASVLLAGGASIRELARYLGHKDPAFTLRVYTHLIEDSHERARRIIDERFSRTCAVSDGAQTEQPRQP
jgi:integrase